MENAFELTIMGQGRSKLRLAGRLWRSLTEYSSPVIEVLLGAH
jgi:hypothetical protein